VENNIVYLQNALNVLLGKNPGNIVRNNTWSQINLENKIPINLPSEVLLNRPDIRQAEQQLKMANADIGVAKSNYFPSITLTSPIGAFTSQLTGLFNPSGDFWYAQILATMPILNLGLNALIKEKKAKYYVAYYNYIQAVKTAFADTDNSLSSVVKAKDTHATAVKMYNIAAENTRLNLENYHLGYMSYPESLSSKITQDKTKITLTQVKLLQVQAILKAYQALAGGYNYKNTDKSTPIDDAHDYD
jgi:outer membrane protein, multidrug efflux system